jgi:hypothetical protein
VDPVPDPLLLRKVVVPRNEPGTSDHQTTDEDFCIYIEKLKSRTYVVNVLKVK